ncbi:MAG: hypothetical protein GY801_15145, partial [bacterium]|nr:hypothetical protein [bacterium]
YNSCWNAVQAARNFLEEHFPEIIENRSLCVKCRFQNPTAEYNDTSASLLVGLKLIGDVLDIEIDPQTLVSGEVDESGKILPVTCTAEKTKAAEKHPGIHQIYLPSDGLFVESNEVIIFRVRTFPETIKYYYGEPLQKKLKQVSRRKVLKSAATAIVAVPLGLFMFRNIFTHPVTEQDVWSMEYAKELYQQHFEFQQAIRILTTLLQKFQQEDSLPEALRLKAGIFGHLGLIYVQQYSLQEGLSQLRKTFRFWQRMHDREQQFRTLLNISEVYHHALTVTGNKKSGEESLKCIQQAKH